jgi:hypothetical protein
MLAILEDAAATLARNAGGRTTRERQAVAEVEGWCSSEDRRWPFSFSNICETLAFDPSYLRNAFKRLKAAATADAGRRDRPYRMRRRSGTRTRVVAPRRAHRATFAS